MGWQCDAVSTQQDLTINSARPHPPFGSRSHPQMLEILEIYFTWCSILNFQKFIINTKCLTKVLRSYVKLYALVTILQLTDLPYTSLDGLENLASIVTKTSEKESEKHSHSAWSALSILWLVHDRNWYTFTLLLGRPMQCKNMLHEDHPKTFPARWFRKFYYSFAPLPLPSKYV